MVWAEIDVVVDVAVDVAVAMAVAIFAGTDQVLRLLRASKVKRERAEAKPHRQERGVREPVSELVIRVSCELSKKSGLRHRCEGTYIDFVARATPAVTKSQLGG